MTNNAVIYTRLSAARQGDEATLETQETTCRQLAEAAGLEVTEVFAEGSGVSAFKGVARPQLDRLVSHLKANPGTTVIAWEISRLTRRLRDLGMWAELLDDSAVRILTPQLDTAQSAGRLLLSITATMAEEESATKAVRVTDGKNRQRANGEYLGGTAPLGYRRSENGGLVLDPSAAETMRLAVSLFLDDGLSVRAVCMELNARGILSPRGSQWRHSSIAKAFRSSYLAGLQASSSGALEPVKGLESGGVVTAGRWREVTARLDSLSGPAKKAKGRPPVTLLSSVMACNSCGGAMSFDKARGSHGGYRCAAASSGACKGGSTVARHLIEPFVVAEVLGRLDALMSDAPEGDELAEILKNYGADVRPEIELERRQTEDELSGLLAKVEHLTDSFLAGSLPEEAYTRALEQTSDQEATLRAALEALPPVELTLPLNVIVILDEAETPQEMVELFVADAGGMDKARAVVLATVGKVSVPLGRKGVALTPERVCYGR